MFFIVDKKLRPRDGENDFAWIIWALVEVNVCSQIEKSWLFGRNHANFGIIWHFGFLGFVSLS